MREHLRLMISERDIYATALLLTKQHGESAWLIACQRCDEMIESGDAAGLVTWRRIAAAVDDISAAKPSGSMEH